VVLVRARCGCSEISKQWVARHSHFTGLPALLLLLLLLTTCGSTALETRENISIDSIAPAPFISKEAPTCHGTEWILRARAFCHLSPNR